MRTIGRRFSGWAILGSCIALAGFIQAQITQNSGTAWVSQNAVDWRAASDWQVMIQAIQSVSPTPADLLPPTGTFFSASIEGGGPPFPANINHLAAWNLGDGIWLLDDLNPTPQLQSVALTGSMMTMSAPMPGAGSGDGGTNAYTPEGSGYAVDFGTNLGVCLNGMVSNNLVGTATNTLNAVYYELQTNSDLLSTNWISAGFVLGSEVTNWTAWSVPMSGPSNLFVRVLSWQSSYGTGIPDWWWLRYVGYVGSDAFAFTPAGDGFTYWDCFVEGLNPAVFNTPAAPKGVTVTLNQANNTATVSWLQSPGPVTGYTVEKTDSYYYPPTVQDFTVSASTTGLPNDVSGDPIDYWYGDSYDVSYRVQAHYAGGNSAWSASVPLQQPTLSGWIIPGTNGLAYLAVSSVPANAVTVRLVYIDYGAEIYHQDFSFNFNHDIPVSAFTNGFYQLPPSWQPPTEDVYDFTEYWVFVQTVDANGNVGAATRIYTDYPVYPAIPHNWGMPFYDNRVQLKQNLVFQLRAASIFAPFYFLLYSINGQFFSPDSGPYIYPINYAYAGLFQYIGPLWIDVNAPPLDPFYPVKENCLFRNFVFTTNDVDGNGDLTTGAYMFVGLPFYGTNYTALLHYPPEYYFQTNWTSFPTLLGDTARWFLYDQTDWSTDNIWNDGLVSWDNSYDLSVSGGLRNWFGLPYLSVNVAYQKYDEEGPVGLATNAIPAGTTHSFSEDDYYSINYGFWDIYLETAQPQFQTVEYDFWRVGVWGDYDYTLATIDPLPGSPAFSPTNTSRLMITGVGDNTFQVAGYAKLAVTNAYPGVYGYLGQYFDQAYTENTNGIATTNTTGVLSPYGYFFPTEPGPVALLTMPDIDTGARGTCTVYCASMNVDKNADGTMDLSFSGPDATSQASPMVVWVNNGHTVPSTGGKLDHDEANPRNVSPNYSAGQVTCPRDLENFFRIWICGLPALPMFHGYTVTLSFQNPFNNPAINLYWSCETNGGTGYLTQTNTAAMQSVAISVNGNPPIGSGASLGTVSNNCTYTFPDGTFAAGGTQYLLFEGAGIGSGELTLTISQNGNILAQTGVWLDLHDIKDFYEQMVITNNTSGSISNWTSGIEMVKPATSSALGGDTNLIVFVHGINVDEDDWRIESDAVFKRLYWAGYQGKFAAVKWPCKVFTTWTFLMQDYLVFADSEIIAYKASAAMKAYVDQLHARFPGYRLHLFVHSQGNSVVSEAIEQGAAFDTYILTQGAMPASSYDANSPLNTFLVNYESTWGPTPEWQPMGYRAVYTNMPGQIVNFYNTNDPVLAEWVSDQAFSKPNTPITDYSYDGANGWYHELFSKYLVTDPQESRAYVSRSRTSSIGQSGPASGHGVIKSAVDLHANFGFYNAFPADHSAQWTWPIQTTYLYYKQILLQIQPSP